ncbi:MAG: diguanylate cyclase [Solobacterium sp.]|nr:diguanylate cyclase [Solobacterium sp.]
MPTLKGRIIRYLILIIGLAMIFEVVVSLWIQSNNAERRAGQNADIMFEQIGQVLSENQAELEKTAEEYRELCLSRADTAAYILERTPELVNDPEELRRIAAYLRIDEIHLFDRDGVIFSGTHPEYYGISVRDGEQIGYFEKMLEDRTMRLVQESAPNTAEGREMQYSAVWSPSGTYFVQIGMPQTAVARMTGKNEISYIFHLLKGGRGVNLLAIDPAEGTIIGADDSSFTGRYMSDIGLSKEVLASSETGKHCRMNGISSYLITRTIGSYVICYVVSTESMYQNLTNNAFFLACALMLTSALIVFFISLYIDRHVIRNFQRLNDTMALITEGELDKTADVNETAEFAELSSHINELVRSLLANTEKISYILNKTDIRIGVYEFSTKGKSVRVTERIPELLGLSKEDADYLTADYHEFERFIEDLKNYAVAGEENLYAVEGKELRYLRFEERRNKEDVFGIIIDMTKEFSMRRRIESERDIDLLTGILNRRGLKLRIESIMAGSEDIGHGVLCMIDADGLKGINDTYGHLSGDQYLEVIAGRLKDFGSRKHIAGRLGGDEFVLFLYGYPTEEELSRDIARLKELQNSGSFRIEEGGEYTQEVPIRFSMGYSRITGEDDSSAALQNADEQMYLNKTKRRQERMPEAEESEKNGPDNEKQ